MTRHLHIGGLVAIGFSAIGDYMLTISHSGRGVFTTDTWERVARNVELAYPEEGIGIGIGPISEQLIPMVEINYDTGLLNATTPDGQQQIDYSEGTVVISPLSLPSPPA